MSTSKKTTRRLQTSRPRSGRRGFTLIEIVVAVIIIGVLAALITPRILGRIGESKESAAKSDIKTIESLLSGYLADLGLLAPDDDDLSVLLLKPDDGGGPHGPYLRNPKDLEDPWGNLYILRTENTFSADFDIISMGQDGEPDTDDDITNYD